MIHGQKMEISLGLPIWIDGFKDSKPRKAYPFTLENLLDANLYLSSFDNNDIYVNFKNQEATLSMAKFFSMSFRIDDDDELMELLENIDKDNFADIVRDIKMISGISDTKGDIDINKTSKTMDWDVAVNSIPVYTSTPIYKVKEMTLIQFNKTLELIGKKITYEYKTNTLSMVKEPDKYIKESDHPLYSEEEIKHTKLTLKDISGFIQ